MKDNIKRWIFVSSLLAVIWLVSAIENCGAGSWAWWCAVGIILGLVCLAAYDLWKETDEYKKVYRKGEKLEQRVLEQTQKEMYLRKITY